MNGKDLERSGRCVILRHYPGILLERGWRNFLRVRAQIVDNFGEIMSYTHGNFQEKNRVLESFITDYYFVIIFC
jgi:hypothetical protein